MKNLISLFMRNDSGSSSIEYSMLASVIAIGCMSAFGAVGESLFNHYIGIGDALDTAVV
jgi:Flp pilus assembly pilin Flp